MQSLLPFLLLVASGSAAQYNPFANFGNFGSLFQNFFARQTGRNTISTNAKFPKFYHTLADGTKVCACFDPINGYREHDSSWISAMKFKLRCDNGTTEITGTPNPSISAMKFKLRCDNGTTEITACIGSRAGNYVEVPVNETKDVGGFYHKCTEEDGAITYDQEPSCVVSGKELHINETFRQNNFKMQCEEWGYSIAGCFYGAEGNDTELAIGDSADEENLRHFCEKVSGVDGRVRYRVQAVRCKYNDEIHEEGDSWVTDHLKYLCKDNGAISIINCVTENGTEIAVGQAIVVEGSLHRCFRQGPTVYYQANKCMAGSPLCNSGVLPVLPRLPAYYRPGPFQPSGEYPVVLSSGNPLFSGRPFFKN